MLHELIRLWPRVRGQRWEKAKIHQQLHVPDDIERSGAPQGSHTVPQNTITSGWLNEQPRVRNSVPKFLTDNWVNALVIHILWTWPMIACRPSMVRHCKKHYHLWGNQPACPPKEQREGYLWTPTATKYPTSYPQHLVLICCIQKKNFSAAR
jgi:hypothetical protein